MLALFTLCAGAATVDGLKPLARAPMLSRRAFGAVGAAAPIAAALAPARAAAADAPPMPVEIPSARMPSWTMLIPIVELDDAVKAWSKRPDTVALDALCKGGLLSAKNFYLGFPLRGYCRRVAANYGHDVDIPRRRVAATPRPRRSVETGARRRRHEIHAVHCLRRL